MQHPIPGLGLLSLCLALGAALSRADTQGPCPAAIRLEGEAEVVAPIASALAQRGISDRTGAGCPLLRARIDRRGPQLAVTVQEEVLHAERLVAGADTAATVIESWARNDISAPLLSARPLPAPPPAPAPLRPALPPVPAPLAQPGRWVVRAQGEFSVDTNGSPWLGGSAQGCTRVGPTCLGLQVRIVSDLLPLRITDVLYQRLGTDIFLAGDLPLHLGRVTLTPGLSLGLGWVRTAVRSDDGDAGSLGNGGMRAEARLGASLLLGRGVGLELGLSLGAAFLQGDPDLLDLPLRSKDADETFGRIQVLPALPWGFVHVGLGLRWSSP